MKTIDLVSKYIIMPASAIIAFVYAFDKYIVDRAKTAVEPTKIKVESIQDDVSEIKIRTRNIENLLMKRE